MNRRVQVDGRPDSDREGCGAFPDPHDVQYAGNWGKTVFLSVAAGSRGEDREVSCTEDKVGKL